MKSLVLFFSFILLNFHAPAQYKVQFIVTEMPAGTHDSIYISGSFNNWEAGTTKYKLHQINTSHQTIVLKLPKGRCEYKFTRGSWLTVEKDNACREIINRITSIDADTTINIIIPMWNDECSEESLKRLLQVEKEDTNKVNTLNILARTILDSKVSLIYSANALSLTKRINFKKGEGIAYRNIAENYSSQNNYAEALKFYLAALKIQEGLKDKSETARTYFNLANTYSTLDNYPEALKNSYSALKLYEKANDMEGMSYAYSAIGDCYFTQGDDSRALENYLTYLKLSENIGAGGAGKFGMGDVNNKMASIYFKRGEYTEALKKDSAAFKIWKELGNNYELAVCLSGIGKIYEKESIPFLTNGSKIIVRKKLYEALKNYLQALKLFYESEDKLSISYSYIHLGNISVKLKNNQSARNYFRKSLQFAKETESKSALEEIYMALAAFDSTNGNFKQAYNNYKLYKLYYDSIYNSDNAKKMVQVQMQYDFDKEQDSVKAVEDKKEAITEAEIQNQKTIRNFSYTGAVALLSFAGVGFYRYKKRRKLQSQQEMLNERLRISRELHDDIGSTLGSISIYSEVAKNRSEKNENAEEAIAKIGNASRELIDKMSDIVWSVNPNNESFEQLQNRIQVFAGIMLTPHEILYTIDADEQLKDLRLSAEERKNIYLIYKEAIHNIIKYAACTQVELKLLLHANKFTMSIRDNGKGFDVNQVQNTNKSLGGNGIKNMIARAENIKAGFNIHSIKNEGTTIGLKLKV